MKHFEHDEAFFWVNIPLQGFLLTWFLIGSSYLSRTNRRRTTEGKLDNKPYSANSIREAKQEANQATHRY